MLAFLGARCQGAANLAVMDVEGLASPNARFGFKKLFRCTGAGGFDMVRELNSRQERVLHAAVSSLQKKDRGRDVFVDVSKSEERAPRCLNATPCVVPNSLLYRLREAAFLSPRQVCCVQGIWLEDFPALGRYAEEKPGLTRDLAGNAFSTTVCMAVVIACFAHAPSLTVHGVRVRKRARRERVPAGSAKRPRDARWC